MKKTHGYFLSFGLVTAIIVIVYVGWTLSLFEPAVTYHKSVDATSKVAAEAYLREHPPKEGQITWTGFWKKVANPRNREKASIFVTNIDNTEAQVFFTLVILRTAKTSISLWVTMVLGTKRSPVKAHRWLDDYSNNRGRISHIIQLPMACFQCQFMKYIT